MTDNEVSDNPEEEEEEEGVNEQEEEKNEETSEEKDEVNDVEETVSFAQNLKKRSISSEMEESYLDYAMSVIVSRALPDVRDGLKPVHRRILYAMHDIGLKSGASFRKSAAVVGEVLGKYHPHGDTAVYDSMVRMAQDFALRYPLVKGQGNFGSIDGDRPAAMRYTEAKLEKISDAMLSDIDKETVDWNENYDGRYKEPSVLPSRLPQLLLNGTTGIAVGMATSIPSHNLGELIDAIIYLIGNSEATIDDLMEFVKGPDFPTAGKIYDVEAIKEAYATGRGGITMRARAEIEEQKGGKYAIIITEIPYQVNKANLVEKIANLVRDKKIKGISDIRDESNKEGIRIVIELKKDSFPKKILNQLYKSTMMQMNFNMNMIALVDGIQPRLLNLKQVLSFFIKHRQEVVTRRTKHNLRIAQERAHILEGLKVAIDNIDEIIATIKKSANKEKAHASLMQNYKLSDKQATAILEMKLQTLAGLERQRIEDEYKEKLALISKLEAILKDPGKIMEIIKNELAEIKEKYADERKTEIIPQALGKFSHKDTIPNRPMIVILSKEGYIKRVTPTKFRSQHRGGKGIIGVTTKEKDEIYTMKHAKNHNDTLFFTNQGRVFKLPVYEIPQTSRTAKGQPVVNLLQLGDSEHITSMFIINEEIKGKYLVMATKKGTIKKTEASQYENVRKSGLIAIKLRKDDSLQWVHEASPGDEVMIVTNNGKCIRFNENDVRSMGRASMGVRGIKLKDDDKVVEMDTVQSKNAELFVLMENGLGKSTKISRYRLQNRGGTGVKTARVTGRTGKIIGAKVIEPHFEGDAIIISKKGNIIRLNLKDIPTQGRTTQGVYLMRLKKSDKVSSLSIIRTDEIKKDIEESEEEVKKTREKEIKQVYKGIEKLVDKEEGDQKEEKNKDMDKNTDDAEIDDAEEVKKPVNSEDKKNKKKNDKEKTNPNQPSLL